MAQTETERLTAGRLAAEFGLTVHATYVPWSQSRSFDPKIGKDASRKSLNWRVTVRKDGRDVFTTDYTAGIGHAPSVKNHDAKRDGMKWSILHCARVEAEVEGGFEVQDFPGSYGFRSDKDKPLLPDAADVLYCLSGDGRAVEYSCFEDWAVEYGYDEDSRKAYATYQACLDAGLRLRAALGDRWDALLSAFEGY